MRVLVVYPKIYVYGGAELLLVRLCNYLTKKGIKNSILTTSILPEVQEDLIGTNIIIRKIPKIPSILNNLFRLNEIIALNKGIRNNLSNFDLINVHNYPAEISIFPYRKPTVWMCNEPELYLIYPNFSLKSKLLLRIFFEMEKFIVRHYIRNVVTSDEYNSERFRKIYGFEPEIINYGIDYEFFSQKRAGVSKKVFGLSNNFVVLQVGMLTPFKNQLESVKIIEKLRNKIPQIKLVLIGWGEGRYKIMLEEYIRDKRLEDYVIFVSHVNREKLRDYYYSCDVLLHPIKPQGGWLSPFEVLCAKKPIVVSCEMTASEIIKRENIGIVTSDYEGAIMKIYRNPDKYNEIAKKGAKWVKENLSWDNFCGKMLNLFCKAIENNKK